MQFTVIIATCDRLDTATTAEYGDYRVESKTFYRKVGKDGKVVKRTQFKGQADASTRRGLPAKHAK